MNEINFPSPENQWNGNTSTTSSGPYMQSSYTEYLGLPFKIEAGSNIANAQYTTSMSSVQQYHNNQYANGQYHNFIPPKQPTTMLMEIANIKQEPTSNGGGGIPPTSLAALNFQEMFEKEKKASKFKCDICGKYFAKKPTLKLHMRTHTGERPYHCNVCGKSFTQKQSVKIHMRIHTGEKPFKCETCDYTARTKGNLDNHMRKHTGERPFICKICQKSYTQKSSLNTHVKTVHSDNMIGTTKKDNKERPYQCTICSKRYTQKSSLNTHMKGTHNASINDTRPNTARTDFNFSSSSSSKSFGSVSDVGGIDNGKQVNGMSCQNQNGAPANGMHMLTPQSNCSSGYPSPTIRKENMLPFHMTPLLQSL